MMSLSDLWVPVNVKIVEVPLGRAIKNFYLAVGSSGSEANHKDVVSYAASLVRGEERSSRSFSFSTVFRIASLKELRFLAQDEFDHFKQIRDAGFSSVWAGNDEKSSIFGDRALCFYFDRARSSNPIKRFCDNKSVLASAIRPALFTAPIVEV